jgi:hypothetical protein
MTNEQIQSLKAAADATQATEWEFHERYLLSHAGGGYVSINGVEAIWCLNKAVGGMAHSKDVLRYIAAANPAAILSLLAERDADKALIAESVVLFETLRQRIAELEQRHCGGALMEREEHHVGVVNKLLERIAELEARTLTVKLPEYYDMLWQRNPGGSYETVEAISVMKIKAC